MEKILVIQLSRLGDLVQTLPLLKRLKGEKGERHISLLCLKEFSEIVAESVFIDRLLCITAADAARLKSGQEKIEAIEAIWVLPALREEYDLVVNVTHDLAGTRICNLAQGKKTVGRIHTIDGELRFAGDWAKYLVALSQNRLQNLFNLVDIYMGMGEVAHRPTSKYLEVTRDWSSRAMALLNAAGYQGKKGLVAFQMGANRLHRAWLPEYYARLCEDLTSKADTQIVLLGTESERALVRQFEEATKISVIDLVGKTRLTELAGVLQQCDILVSNDTGTGHVAAAVGTPVLGLYFSSAYYSETAPYGAGNVIVQFEHPCSPCHEREICSEMRCREAMPAEVVSEAACAMLEGSNPFPGRCFENLAIYGSRFLSNGTLCYVPLSVLPMPERYWNAFLNRMMWEVTLGLKHDKVVIEKIVSESMMHKQFRATADNYLRGFSLLRDLYVRGIDSAQKLVCEFLEPSPDKAKIMHEADRLGRIETDISQIDLVPGLSRDFHAMEMMDTDAVQYPALAIQHKKKYQRLLGITEGFMAELAHVTA